MTIFTIFNRYISSCGPGLNKTHAPFCLASDALCQLPEIILVVRERKKYLEVVNASLSG